MEKKHLRNEQIEATSVLLIGSDGKPHGSIPIENALQMAEEDGLDLVEMSSNGAQSVCKIMDYGSFLYHENKKKHDSQVKNKGHDIKEMRFRPVTDDGDFQTKVRQIIGFLQKGHPVKVAIRFKGREISNMRSGFEMLEKITQSVSECGQNDSPARAEGKQVVGMFLPSKKKAGPKG